MQRAIIAGAALAAACVYAAQAQVSGPPPNGGSPTLSGSMSATAPPPPPNLREPHGLMPGMVVMDRHGAKVGIITQVNQIRNGQPAVLLDVNGTPITVLASKLKVSCEGDTAIISLTRSQIRTSAILNTY